MSQESTEHRDGSFDCHTLICAGPVTRYCKALIAADVAAGPLPLTVVPHDSVLLSLQFARGGDPFARPVERGALPHLCTWRSAHHSYVAGGGCRSFFALLTPAGAVALAGGQDVSAQSQPRRPLAGLLDRARLRILEDALAREEDAGRQLGLLGAWLEGRLQERQHLPWQALRAARVAASMLAEPAVNMERLAAGEGLSRRQLERDFRRWFNASPKQASLMARGQAAARLGLQGLPMAQVAQQLGFVDQAHLNRVVKNLFGISPPALARTAQTAMSRAFRHATGGGVVYL